MKPSLSLLFLLFLLPLSLSLSLSLSLTHTHTYTSGVLHSSCFLLLPCCSCRVGLLRIYNNGNKSAKVQFEHAVLAQLAQQKLSFEVPTVIRSKAGRPHELLSTGAECCVFSIIPGTLAKTTSPEEVGRATGELNTAMGKVKVGFRSGEGRRRVWEGERWAREGC